LVASRVELSEVQGPPPGQVWWKISKLRFCIIVKTHLFKALLFRLTVQIYYSTMMVPSDVDFLILGAGWSASFLIPLLKSSNIKYAATTTTGHDETIPFKFDPESNDVSSFKSLPSSKTILITFPLKGQGQSKKLVELYNKVHPTESKESSARWIQLGSTGIFKAPHWNNSSSPYDKDNARAVAEDELLSLHSSNSTVLNLAGLYDDTIRSPKNCKQSSRHECNGFYSSPFTL
jgi:hypothetical protein